MASSLSDESSACGVQGVAENSEAFATGGGDKSPSVYEKGDAIEASKGTESDCESMVSAHSERGDKAEEPDIGKNRSKIIKQNDGDYAAALEQQRLKPKTTVPFVVDQSCGAPPVSYSIMPSLDTLPVGCVTESQRQQVQRVTREIFKYPLTEGTHQNVPEEENKVVWFRFLEEKNDVQIQSLSLEELLWCNELAVLRYLRSYGWNEEIAFTNIKRTLWWRRLRKPDHISPTDVRDQFEKGKIYRRGYDHWGNPLIYFKLRNETTTDPREMVNCMIYTLERAMQSIPYFIGAERLTFLFDFNGWSASHAPSIDATTEVIQIMNDYYTDMLFSAFIIDTPTFFEPLWKLVKLLVHPETANKVRFVSRENPEDLEYVKEQIPLHFLETSLGGTDETEYCHDVYWKQEEIQYLEHQMNVQKLLKDLETSELVKKWPRVKEENWGIKSDGEPSADKSMRRHIGDDTSQSM